MQIRQRSPWLTYDTVYNLTPSGREHNRCLEILHGFTNKVPHYIYSIFIKENCIQLRKEKRSSNTLFCLWEYVLKEYEADICETFFMNIIWINQRLRFWKEYNFVSFLSRQDLIRFKFNGNKSLWYGGWGGGGSRRIFKGLKCCFGTSKCSTSTPALFILVSPPPLPFCCRA